MLSWSGKMNFWRDKLRGINYRVLWGLFVRHRRKLVIIRTSLGESWLARLDSQGILSVRQDCYRVRKYLWSKVVLQYLTIINSTRYLRRCLHLMIWGRQLISFSGIIAIVILNWKLCLNVCSVLSNWIITKNLRIWLNCTKFQFFIRKLLKVCLEISVKVNRSWKQKVDRKKWRQKKRNYVLSRYLLMRPYFVSRHGYRRLVDQVVWWEVWSRVK